MTNLIIAVGCLMCVLFAIAVTSIVKAIAKAICKKKGLAFNGKAWEYPLWAIAFISSFGFVVLFLLFYAGWTDYIEISWTAFRFAAVAETVYIIIVQAPRKGIVKIILLIKRLTQCKNPVAEAPAILQESAKEDATPAELAQLQKSDTRAEEVQPLTEGQRLYRENVLHKK